MLSGMLFSTLITVSSCVLGFYFVTDVISRYLIYLSWQLGFTG